MTPYTPPEPAIRGPDGTGSYFHGFTEQQLRSEVERVRRETVAVSWNLEYKDSTPKLNVMHSAFENWFQAQPFATQVGIKQMCRDSYAAGMGDPLVTYAHPAPHPISEPPSRFGSKELQELILAKMTEQPSSEPVAWTSASWLSNPHAGHYSAKRTDCFNVPLYTHPAPQPVELVKQLVDVLEKSQDYVIASSNAKLCEGWGDQLDEAETAIILGRTWLGENECN